MKCYLFFLGVCALLLVGCRDEPNAAATSIFPSLNPTPITPPPTLTSIPMTAEAPPPTPTTTGLDPEGPPPSGLFDVAWEERSLFATNLIPNEQGILSGLPGATVYHLDITIDESLTGIRGRVELLYTNRDDTPLNEIYLRLFPQLFGGASTASEVQVNRQAITPDLELNGSALRLPLITPLEPGAQVVISMNFVVTVPTTPEGNYGAFATIDSIMALAHFYPMVTVFDDEGWNIEIAPPAGDVVYAEASFYLVRITAPADLILITSGVITERQMVDNQQIVTAAAGPARDFYIAGSPRFVAVSGASGESIVTSYTLPEYEDRAREVLDYALYALNVYGTHYGPYPYTELEIASTPNQALGIEYPGVFVNTMTLYTPEQEFSVPDSYYIESTTAHETAHQWFYNTVGNDQLDDPWLDEAMAQFSTYLYFLDRYGVEGAQGFADSFTLRWERGANNADIPVGLPVRDYTGPEYSAIVYGRGPLFFLALQDEMGLEPFAAFLQDYYRSYQWGIATTEGLQAVAEAHCGCDLTTLFAAWVLPH